MKKFITLLALSAFSGLYAQITVTSNLPSNINSGSSFDAEIKINKGTVGNFAKYQMDAPLGYVVSAVDVKGGNFTFENQRAKIVWVSIPSETEVIIKFKIQANSDAANPGTFMQKFFYLENNEKKEVEGASSVVTIGDGGSSAVAATTLTETKPIETKLEEAKPVETKVVETKVEETKPVETKVVETKPVETKPVETVTTTNSSPTNNNVIATSKMSSTTEAGMTFRVQLGAFSVEPSKGKFASAGKVYIDMINGMYKVTAGNFNSKEDAIKFRDELSNKGYSGFIAKYKDGKRIN
jgi:cell division septation protein DedD